MNPSPKTGFRSALPLLLLALVACPPRPLSPPPDASDGGVLPPAMRDGALPPAPDAASADLFDEACTTLALLSCPEGLSVAGGRSCADTMRANSGLYDFGPERLRCYRRAQTKAEARACGKLGCP